MELDHWAATARTIAALPAAVTQGLVPDRLLADIGALQAGAAVRPRVVVLSTTPAEAGRLLDACYPTAGQALAGAGPIRVQAAPMNHPTPTFEPPASDNDLAAALRDAIDHSGVRGSDLDRAFLAEPVAEVYRGTSEVRWAVARRAALLRLAAAVPAALDGRLRVPAKASLPSGPLGAVRVTRPTLTYLPSTAGDLRRTDQPDPDPTGLAALTRAEILDADALLVVVDYDDIVATGRPAASTDARLDQLVPWIRFGLGAVEPERVTVAVDGIERSRSAPTNRRDWVARLCRRKLRLPMGWSDNAVVETRSRPAAEMIRRYSAGTIDVEADPEWSRTGLPAILHRTVGPWLANADAATVDAVRGRLTRTVTDLGRWCDAVLAMADPPGTPPDPALVLDPGYARERETWLLASGARLLLTAAAARLRRRTAAAPPRRATPA